MGTGSSAESQGIRNDTPVPTEAELAQITNAVLANQRQQQQAQYVPPQASVYTPPEAQIYTPPAAQVYTPPASQIAGPGITALLPQDQGAQTLTPNTFTPTPLMLSEPQASIYTPPTQQVYTPPASQVYTPEARSEPAPQDKFFTAPAEQAAQPAAQQAPQLSAPTQQDALAALKIAERKAPFDARYDVNGDGVVDTSDYMGLQKAYLGKDPGFAFANNTFASPSKKTADDYAAETKANQERIAAEQKETERRQTLLADAQKMNGLVNADLVANNPNLTAQQLSSLAQKNYWSNESEAFSRVMSGMESGKAQLKEVEVGADEWGTPIKQLALTTGERPGFDTLYLKPTSQEGVYQFSTHNQVAGGTIHGLVQADPKTGEYKPIADYTKQIQYTPGTSGSFFGNVADAFGDAIGSFGDIYKSLGPIAPILGNAIAPGLGSALSAAAALDEGNTTGAILSGLSAAGAYGGDAARNALAAEVSGNADLASQYSSGLGGTLAQNLPEIKTATSAAQLANALDKGNVLGAISAGANLTDTQLPSDYKTGLAGLGLAQAIASGNVPLATTLGAQFLPQQSAAPGADVGPPAPAGISSLVPALQQAQQETAQTAQQETPADVQVAQNNELPPDTNAGLNQLIQAINNPESTSSYTGTQVADLSGTTGLPSNEPTDQDLAQLGVGLPEVQSKGIEDLATQQEDYERRIAEAQQQEARLAEEEEQRERQSLEDQRRQEEAYWAARREVEERQQREAQAQIEADEQAAQQAELERQAALERERQEEEERARNAADQISPVGPAAVDPNEFPVEAPTVYPNEYVPVEDGTTDGIEDLIKTLPVNTETTDGGDGAFLGSYEDAGDGIAGPGGEGSFPGTEEGTVGSDQTTEVTDMDDDFDGGDGAFLGSYEDASDGIVGPGGEGSFPGINDGTVGSDQTNELDAGQGEGAFPGTEEGTVGSDQPGGDRGLTPDFWQKAADATGLSPGLVKLLAGSLGLGGLGSLLGQQQPSAPAQTPYTGPLSNIQFNPATYTPYTYKPYAGGGAVGEVMNNNGYTIGVGYPEVVNAMAAGGIASLGGYSDGGRLLRGPGDGVSDSIPAVIGNKQPARLADGEFVIPARIVSELGNGSTEAGARQLYAMMDRIQAARRKTVGKDKVAANTKASKHLPA